VSPAYAISFLRITGQDQSVMEFRLHREKLNPPLATACSGRAAAGPRWVDGISRKRGGPNRA